MGYKQIGKFPHTAEQKIFIGAALTGAHIRCQAVAGSGKTSTAIEVAGNLALQGKKGLYLCFNKKNADEAKEKFPSSVQCRTAHSLAWWPKGRWYKHRLRRMKAANFAETLGVDYKKDTRFGEPAGKFLTLALATITKFCQSGNAIIEFSHVPQNRLLSLYETAIDDRRLAQDITAEAAEAAQALWEAITARGSKLPASHDVYLKEWQLTSPDLSKFDYIIFDEAQDASGVMLDIVVSQQEHCQLIFIGDTYQQIYSWRGAVNAMEQLPDLLESFTDVSLTQAFRYGEPQAKLATKILQTYREADITIKGYPGFANAQIANLAEGEYDAYICRTNAAVLAKAIHCARENIPFTVIGGLSHLQRIFEGVENLQNGNYANCPELSGFGSWSAVEKYAQQPEGSDLKWIVKAVSDYGTPQILSTLCEATESDAGLTITTAHKCKGMEWKRVKLAADFRFDAYREEPEEDAEPDWLRAESANLLYVACTRAQEILDPYNAEPIEHVL